MLSHLVAFGKCVILKLKGPKYNFKDLYVQFSPFLHTCVCIQWGRCVSMLCEALAASDKFLTKGGNP